MKLIPAVALALPCLVLTNCSLEQTAGPGESHLSLTDDGAWCWFSDPRAIYDNSFTYTGWVDSTGNIVVGSYDHDQGQVSTHILHPRLERDDHDNPSFLLDRGGNLMVFYAMHAHDQPIYLARATTAGEISQWASQQELRLNDSVTYARLSNTYTYANIVRLADERDRLFLFWRGADFKPNVATSEDAGATWTLGEILILPERTYRNRRPYLKVGSNNRDVIHLAFTDGHPNAEPTNSIYYASYSNGFFRSANGDTICAWNSLPIDPAETDRVYDATTTGEKAWIWDVAEDTNGDPVIVYSRFPNDSSHVYCYATWDGTQWRNREMINSGKWFPHTLPGTSEREPNYSGGIALDHADPSIVYLSVTRNGRFEIEQWTTPDNGESWHVEAITSNSKYDNVRPFVVRNHPAGKTIVLWMNVKRYRHYTDFASAIKFVEVSK